MERPIVAHGGRPERGTIWRRGGGVIYESTKERHRPATVTGAKCSGRRRRAVRLTIKAQNRRTAPTHIKNVSGVRFSFARPSNCEVVAGAGSVRRAVAGGGDAQAPPPPSPAPIERVAAYNGGGMRRGASQRPPASIRPFSKNLCTHKIHQQEPQFDSSSPRGSDFQNTPARRPKNE